MGKRTLFLTHLYLFLPKKMVFIPKLSLFLPKKCVFFPKKRLFIRNKRKNRVKKGCFWPKNAQNNRFISSEEKGISSEVIAISSEGIGFSSEEKGISSEFGEQRKEKKYISIYISFSIRHQRVRVCACIVRMRIRARACTHIRAGRQKKTSKESFAGCKKINRALLPVWLFLCRTKNHSHET